MKKQAKVLQCSTQLSLVRPGTETGIKITVGVGAVLNCYSIMKLHASPGYTRAECGNDHPGEQ